jgi:hypothetical protein
VSELNIYQRINAVMKAVEYVQKDATVETGGGKSYRAVTHDMVLAVLRKAMVEQGIVTTVEQISNEMIQLRDVNLTPKPITMHLYSGTYRVRFINMYNPTNYAECTVNAHATDSMDKAPSKAISTAVKYAMLKTFGLETGENDEGRLPDFQPFTDVQKEEFDAFIESNNDPFGFLCFTKTIGDDVFGALQSTFPAGKIVAGKKVANQLITDGFEILHNTAVEVEKLVAAHDTDGLLQIIEEFQSPIQRKLLGGLLKPQELKAIRELKELSA